MKNSTRTTVCAGGVVFRARGRSVEVLVVERHTNVEPKWAPVLRQLPKGAQEGDETLDQTAAREVLEETGYPVDLLGKAGTAEWTYERGGSKWREVVHYFFMHPRTRTPQPHDYEFDCVTWILLEEAQRVLSYPEERVLLANVGGRRKAWETTRLSQHTKAARLRYLEQTVKRSVVDRFFSFTVHEWINSSGSILQRVQSSFGPHERLIIRSSAVGEDRPGRTFAGAFRSFAGIAPTDRTHVRQAIKRVATSFTAKSTHFDAQNEIIVQRYVRDAVFSGVVLTWDTWQDRPYYVVNFDSGSSRTDSVTSGRRSETIRVLRGSIHFAPNSDWHRVLTAVREVEHLFRDRILYIEFALDSDHVVHVFQVRILARKPRAASRHIVCRVRRAVHTVQVKLDDALRVSDDVPGGRTIFSDMADWNPAEMLGDRPRALSISLYQYLITDEIWNVARQSLGYCDVAPAKLLLVIAGKPYIDTRVSFNSLLPNVFPGGLREALIGNCLDVLHHDARLHDKIEFEIALSCYDLSTERRLAALRGVLSPSQIASTRRLLVQFTNRLLAIAPTVINSDLRVVYRLERRSLYAGAGSGPAGTIAEIARTLEDCRTYGVLPFSRLARLAFIGMSILRSLVTNSVISAEQTSEFLRSLQTVGSSVHLACERLTRGIISFDEFKRVYGHLRPSTYDITASRYGDIPETFWLRHAKPFHRKASTLQYSFAPGISRALRGRGLEISEDVLLRFIKRAIEAREYAKFVFTKWLSHALELIAQVGDHFALPREAMSHVTVTLFTTGSLSPAFSTQKLRTILEATHEKGVRLHERYAQIALPPVLFSPADLDVVRYTAAAPTFVTSKSIRGRIHNLTDVRLGSALDLRNRIVLLEKADPGYDWIFALQPLGLITKYGGAGSHMAVRCAEFDLPAALGCGQAMFDLLQQSFAAVLDCTNGTIAPI